MAEQDETSMIGYDPLAWMHELQAQQTLSGSEDNMVAGNIETAMDLSSTVSNTQSVNNSASTPEEDPELLSVAAAETQISSEQAQQIVLEPVQNIQNVGKLYGLVLQALNQSEKIDIDASCVNMIDTASLQLLLVLKRTAIKQHKQVSIDFPSDKFIDAANLLGLSEMLDVDQAASGFF